MCVRECVHTSVAVAWGNVATVLCFLKHFLLPRCFHNHLILSVNQLLSLTDALGAPKNQAFFFFFFCGRRDSNCTRCEIALEQACYTSLCVPSVWLFILRFFLFFPPKTYFIHHGCLYIYIFFFFFFCISLERLCNRERCHFG